jgi:hypothetical protein
MKKPFLNWMIVILLLSIFSTSCSKDEEEDLGNEEELITTLRLTLRETGSATVKVFEFKDPDGTGGNPPTKFDPIILSPSKNYTCTIEVLNESVSPVENITAEIIAESDDHQFYFEPAGVNIFVINLDTDTQGLPLGVSSTWNTGAASNGTVKITLKHKPGAKLAGDLVNKGETDIEVNFTAQVQ